MLTTTRLIYQQFDDTPMPDRFIEIAEALLRSLGNVSARQILHKADLSHSWLYSLRSQPGRQPDKKKIQAFVRAINQLLPTEERWPEDHALASAGHRTGKVK